MHKPLVIASLLALGALSSSGCFFTSKTRTSSQPQAVEHKNHGQERKDEVHERNAARKEAHDAQKAAKKDDK